MNNKKSKFGFYYVIFFMTVFTILGIRGCLIQDNIKANGKNIIAKFLKKKNFPKTTHFYFGYYYNGNYFETNGSGVKYSILNSEEETNAIDSLKLHHFYSAKFNDKYPESIIVDPSKEITDSIAIKDAGF